MPDLMLMQMPTVLPLVTDGKAVSLAVISVGLFVWSSITNFLNSKETKASNKSHEAMTANLVSILASVVDIVQKTKDIQVWQKESWKKIEEVKKIEVDNGDDLNVLAEKLAALGHQMELVAQNQLSATNGLQQVINRMLDIIKDATKES
jgi:hypothetical protein